jgi:hypothetical protein
MSIATKACDHCGNDYVLQEIHICWNKGRTSTSWICERCMKTEGLDEAK